MHQKKMNEVNKYINFFIKIKKKKSHKLFIENYPVIVTKRKKYVCTVTVNSQSQSQSQSDFQVEQHFLPLGLQYYYLVVVVVGRRETEKKKKKKFECRGWKRKGRKWGVWVFVVLSLSSCRNILNTKSNLIALNSS